MALRRRVPLPAERLNSVSFSASPFTGAGGTSANVSGDRRGYAFMTNAIYDFNIGWALTPHLGAGIGAVTLHDSISAKPFLSTVRVRLVTTSRQQRHHRSSATRRSPGCVTTSTHPWPSTSTIATWGRAIPTFGASSKTFGVRFLQLGLRHAQPGGELELALWRPPPPVAAPPMPPAPPMVARKVFLVFFDWDRDTITPEGHADHPAGGRGVPRRWAGHDPGYRLCRPVGIARLQPAALRAARQQRRQRAWCGSACRGSQMAVSGRGENDNRVPTADGVREPQNRRVEIVFP